ncbi:MAG: cytochrome c biogenesis protein CcsA, partial [Thermaerobacterales bacterium]
MILAGSLLSYAVIIMAALVAALGLLGALKERAQFLHGARRAALATFVLTSAMVALLVTALLTDRFDILYVASNSERLMEPYFKVAALWSGQAGSLLFWLWLLSGYLALVAWRRPLSVWSLWPWALAVLGSITFFWALLVGVVESPFLPLAPVPIDGNGMNPLLRHPGMLLHPFVIYLGFTGLTVPFAFAIAALLAGRADAAWFQYTRRWTLTAWVFLTIGILAGAQWAYDVLGWGGYWGWDPVENSSLMPWLVATAFLHSAMVQEKRGMLKNWNILLIMLTYALTIVGTLITRGGLISSVHAFAQSPIAPWFSAYLAVLAALCIYLLTARREL